jgi:hypothetical protein
MHKIRFSTLWNLVLVLAMVWGFSSCKSKKKAADVSDPQQVKQEIQIEETDDTPEEPEIEEEPDTAPRRPSAESQLTSFFEAIANSSSPADANRTIQDALDMFSGPTAPVLVIIYSSGSTVDYDEPTTIDKYLNYLKDTGNADTMVEEIVRGNDGKIKELVLRKK